MKGFIAPAVLQANINFEGFTAPAYTELLVQPRAMSQNPAREPPIYIEYMRRYHDYVAALGGAIYRLPVRPEELWTQYNAIPAVPPPGLINNGDDAGSLSFARTSSSSRFPALTTNSWPTRAPTNFIEPFRSGAVEAQLCGTPVATSAYGAFWETVLDGVTGFRCNTLADYVGALRRAPGLARGRIAERARRLYSLETVGRTYDVIFNNFVDQKGDGWFSATSRKFGTEELPTSSS